LRLTRGTSRETRDGGGVRFLLNAMSVKGYGTFPPQWPRGSAEPRRAQPSGCAPRNAATRAAASSGFCRIR
jgi:hypothetical protein